MENEEADRAFAEVTAYRQELKKDMEMATPAVYEMWVKRLGAGVVGGIVGAAYRTVDLCLVIGRTPDLKVVEVRKWLLAVGWPGSRVSELLRVARASDDVLTMLSEGKVGYWRALELVRETEVKPGKTTKSKQKPAVPKSVVKADETEQAKARLEAECSRLLDAYEEAATETVVLRYDGGVGAVMVFPMSVGKSEAKFLLGKLKAAASNWLNFREQARKEASE